MKFGICLPYMEKDFGRNEVISWCKRIDDGPFSSISCGERITGYTLEMRNMLAFAAAVTERVQIVPSLYVLPMHSAVWAAKEIATLDVLSQGRVTMTVGVGGRKADYQAVGASFARRHQRMDEQVNEMKRIWRGEPPFEGADEVGPRPVQKEGPSILAGSMWPKAMARAAKWSDGFYSFSMNGDVKLAEYFVSSAGQHWQEAQREGKPYLVGGFWYSLADNSEQRLKNYVHNYMLTFGEEEARNTADTMTRFSIEAVEEALYGMQQLALDEIFLVPTTADIEEIDRLEALLIKSGLV